ncbi:hypothetical protein F5882DRAFT_372011 [Hyaloscypha sp. PMI_1271]|nr:hypothetical protein F5882DRAFT_372011 [Hyaloscypha sp. PMI_1271]
MQLFKYLILFVSVTIAMPSAEPLSPRSCSKTACVKHCCAQSGCNGYLYCTYSHVIVVTNDTFPNRLFIVRLHSALVVMMKLKCSNVPGFSASIKTSTTKSLILSLNSRGLTKWAVPHRGISLYYLIPVISSWLLYFYPSQA